MSELEELTKQIEDMKSQYREKAKKVLNESVFPDFFKKHPEVTAIYWAQYTPYFNDGDPCVFSVGEVCVTNSKDMDEDGAGPYESFWDGEKTWEIPKSIDNDLSGVATFIGKNEELMLDLFDDHVVVKVYNESPIRCETEEYEHD